MLAIASGQSWPSPVNRVNASNPWAWHRAHSGRALSRGAYRPHAGHRNRIRTRSAQPEGPTTASQAVEGEANLGDGDEAVAPAVPHVAAVVDALGLGPPRPVGAAPVLDSDEIDPPGQVGPEPGALAAHGVGAFVGSGRNVARLMTR